jgi:hypothetical protein
MVVGPQNHGLGMDLAMTLRDLLKDIGFRLLQGLFLFDRRPAPVRERVPARRRAGDHGAPVRARWPNATDFLA